MRLNALPPCECLEASFGIFEGNESDSYPLLSADKVDVPDTAATCRVTDWLPEDLAAATAPQRLFEHARDLKPPSRMQKKDEPEYRRLVVRQLRAGKFGLHAAVSGGGGFFVVGKSEADRLRPIWHGRDVSLAAERPPKPRRLGNPASLMHIIRPSGKKWFCPSRMRHLLRHPQDEQ